MRRLGNCVHACFATAVMAPSKVSIEAAAAAIARWRLDGMLAPGALVAAAERLCTWVSAQQAASRHVEVPVTHRLTSGSVVSGTIDLLLADEAGVTIVDHKTFVDSELPVRVRVAAFAGQLGAYADAVSAATGLPVAGVYVHLPLHGLMVPLAEVTARISGAGADGAP
jgi:ATP-dependent exoDNAse (exonuclease V) beta subunit